MSSTARALPYATIGIVALFVLLALLAYGTSVLENEFVTWDDNGLIFENANVQTLSAETVKNVFTSYDPELYIPATFLTYQLDWKIGHGSPLPFHASNLALHTANALLVTLVLRKLLRTNTLSVLLGLVFLLHPLNVEAVAWAAARKDVLSTFFFLTSLVLFMKAESGKTAYRQLSVLAFGIGLLAKVMIISLPAILVLLDLLRGRRDAVSIVREKAGYIVLAAILGVVALLGKTTVLAASTPWQKVLVAFKAMALYLQKFIIPWGLSFAYPYTKTIALSSPDFFIPVVVVLLLAMLVWRIWRKAPLVAFGSLWFVLTLAPTFINIAKGGDVYIGSDRYAYIPMVGLLIIVGSLLEVATSLSVHGRGSDRRPFAANIALIALLMVYLPLTRAQAAVWNSSVSLYRHALEFYPMTHAAHHNLGMELLGRGDIAGALAEFDLAMRIRFDPKTELSKAAALVQRGDADAARNIFLSVVRDHPDEHEAYFGLGNIALRAGEYREAEAMYQKSLELKPSSTNVLNNLGAMYLEQGKFAEAIEVLRRSTEIRPEFPEAFYNLAGAEEQAGLMTEAAADYRTALSLDPQDLDAAAALARLLYASGSTEEAVTLLQQVLRSDQSHPMGLQLLQRMQKDGIVR